MRALEERLRVLTLDETRARNRLRNLVQAIANASAIVLRCVRCLRNVASSILHRDGSYDDLLCTLHNFVAHADGFMSSAAAPSAAESAEGNPADRGGGDGPSFSGSPDASASPVDAGPSVSAEPPLAPAGSAESPAVSCFFVSSVWLQAFPFFALHAVSFLGWLASVFLF